MADAPVPIDLTSRVIEAATAAIANEGPNLRREPRQVRSIVVEVELDSRGQVSGTDAYTMRRMSPSELVGMRGHPRRVP